ncbi:MAG: hypothetical protein WHS89_11075 [Acidimicrobiales bacterium]
MIVSHQHRFIFMKTRKTAGTSVEVFLSSIAGDDAIVTPFGVAEGIDHAPRNWQRLFNPLSETIGPMRYRSRGIRGRGWSRTAKDLLHRRAFEEHLTARLAIARLGRRTWRDYFTFCFERDPWDKTLSWYWWSTRNLSHRPPLAEWIMTAQLPSDWSTYAIGDDLAVDFVGRYESLEEDLALALRTLGIDVPVELPRAKAQHRPSSGEETFEPSAHRRIAEVFAREIKAFGYEDRSVAC